MTIRYGGVPGTLSDNHQGTGFIVQTGDLNYVTPNPLLPIREDFGPNGEGVHEVLNFFSLPTGNQS